MALKAWIDDIKTAGSGEKSEAQLKQGIARGTESIIHCADYPLPGEAEADEIVFSARAEIVNGGVFHFTAETQAAEAEVNRTYKAILTGESDFDSLRAACARWVKAAQTRPAPPVMASLFPEVKA